MLLSKNPSSLHWTGLCVAHRPGDRHHGQFPPWASSLAVYFLLVNRSNLFSLLVNFLFFFTFILYVHVPGHVCVVYMHACMHAIVLVCKSSGSQLSFQNMDPGDHQVFRLDSKLLDHWPSYQPPDCFFLITSWQYILLSLHGALWGCPTLWQGPQHFVRPDGVKHLRNLMVSLYKMFVEELYTGTHSFNPSTWKVKAGRSLWVWD